MDKPLAGVGQRFTAQFIDGLIAIAFGATFYYVAQLISLPLELWVVGYVFYLLFCDALPSGQSLGKKLTNIAVVHNASNAPCTYWQSFVRNSSLLLLSIIDVIFILGKSKRRLGDYLASTKVVRLN